MFSEMVVGSLRDVVVSSIVDCRALEIMRSFDELTNEALCNVDDSSGSVCSAGCLTTINLTPFFIGGKSGYQASLIACVQL